MAAARSSSLPLRPRELISAKEPTYAEAFYGTTNGEYHGFWHDGTRGAPVSRDVPPIQDVLAARKLVKKPPRPFVTSARSMFSNAAEDEKKTNEIEKVASADIVPRRFPVKADDMEYPSQRKRGADNPLYHTASMAIGNMKPQDHELPDRYFPSTNQFTKGFVDMKPRFTGLNTKPTLSRAHKAFDEYY